MKRRAFFKFLGLAAASPLVSLKISEATAEEIKSLPNYKDTGGILTKEEIEEAGFIAVDTPVFKYGDTTYTCKAFRLHTAWSPDLALDLQLSHGVNAEKELEAGLKYAILEEMKQYKTVDGQKVKFILNAFKTKLSISPGDFTPRCGVYVRMVTV